MTRPAGGGVRLATIGQWGLHAIDAGAPDGNPHEFNFFGLHNTDEFGVNFAGVSELNEAQSGTAQGEGYSVRLTRATTADSFDLSLIRNDGAGTTPVPLQSIAGALSANVNEVGLEIQVNGSSIDITLTPDTGAAVTTNVTDATHRGPWVGAEVLVAAGISPVIFSSYRVGVPAPAVITGPTPAPTPMFVYPQTGDTLYGTTNLIKWFGAGVSEWWLYAGSTQGGKQYYDSGNVGLSDLGGDQGSGIYVPGLPADGSTVHFRLFYRSDLDQTWYYIDKTYTAVTATAPTIDAPSNGATLSTSELFQWSGSDVTEWWLYVGSTVGGSDYFDSGTVSSSTTSVTVANLPTDGTPVYARLWYRYGTGPWQSIDRSYVASGSSPTISTPSPGSILSGISETFNWDGNSSNAQAYWLYVGSTPGGKQYADSGNIGTALSYQVNTLPADASTVYVRLFYQLTGSTNWLHIDAQYTANSGGGIQISPASGAITGASQLLNWTDNGAGVVEWWVYAGTTSGFAGNNYYDSGSLGTTTTTTIQNLPQDGSTVYVTLWYRLVAGGTWQSAIAAFTSN